MSKLRRSLSAAGALLLVSLALAGCVRFDTNLTVNTDETVDGTMVVAVSKTVLRANGRGLDAAFDAAMAPSLSNLPPGTRQEPYDQDGYYGKKITYDDVPFTEFDKATGTSFRPTFRHADGRITFTLTFSLPGSPAIGQELVEHLLRDITIKVVITFPGRVIEQDHGVVSGNTVTWDLRYGDDEPLRAVAEDGAAARWGWFALGGCCLLLVVAVLGLAIWLIRRRSAPAAVGHSGYADPTVGQPSTWSEPASFPPGSDGDPPYSR